MGSIKSKTQLDSDITALGSTYSEAAIETVLSDIVASYENIFPSVTTIQRDALTPTSGDIVYNTDNDRYEYYNGTAWYGIGQDLSTPQTVKVNLSSAEILGLNASAKTLVAAPGSGYAIAVVAQATRYTPGGTGYAGTYSLVTRCSTKTASDPLLTISGNPINGTSAKSGCSAPDGFTANAIVENDSVVLSSTGAITTGNGTLTVWLTFCIIAY